MDSSTSDHDPKQQQQKIVMGYPSMDRYHTVQQNVQMYSPPPPYAPTSSFHHPHRQPYDATSSFHHNHHYPGSSKYQAPPGPYPPQPYNNHMNVSTYYNYQPSYKHLIPENDASRFGRMMLTLMVILVASMCMMSLVMWFLFGTYLPDFEVVSLRVTNFTVTNGTLSGVWDADVAVRNTNHELVVRFEQVRSSVFYKEVLLGLSSMQPFQVDRMQQTEVGVSVPADKNPNSGDNNFQKLQNWLVPTLGKDRANGVVFFSLRLAMMANFTSPTIVYRRENMRVICDDLPVQLLPSGEGKLAPGPTHPCSIRIRDTLKEDDRSFG